MIEKERAFEMKEHALKAIEHLSRLLIISQSGCTADEFERLRTGVGHAIGIISYELLDKFVYAAYPELDDLKS
jgi:hypothetical protein